ncbi:hypothetical protein [Maridesulfovibrio sp.]|uniref:hypothetical protein n=1 Tax=Maridesulfovibrio sp. TaxID=2795000 RepID=UPI003B00A15D
MFPCPFCGRGGALSRQHSLQWLPAILPPDFPIVPVDEEDNQILQDHAVMAAKGAVDLIFSKSVFEITDIQERLSAQAEFSPFFILSAVFITKRRSQVKKFWDS